MGRGMEALLLRLSLLPALDPHWSTERQSRKLLLYCCCGCGCCCR